ncbi:MAG: hypothetical protein IIC02_02860 [Planctomycetes bacterium]|nr:hypothetical protein [Planctomycetota bacterium]
MSEISPTTGVRYTILLLTAIGAMAVSCVQNGRISPGPVIATVEPSGPLRAPTGYLIVYTETRAFLDGDVSYYPYQPYRIYDERGGLVQRVPNHRSNYDEKPTTVELPAGSYFVVPEGGGPSRPRIGVVIKGGELTKVDVESILKTGRSR